MNKNDIKMLSENYNKVLVKENEIPRISLPPNPPGGEQIGPEFEPEMDNSPITVEEYESCFNTIDDRVMKSSDETIGRVWTAMKIY